MTMPMTMSTSGPLEPVPTPPPATQVIGQRRVPRDAGARKTTEARKFQATEPCNASRHQVTEGLARRGGPGSLLRGARQEGPPGAQQASAPRTDGPRWRRSHSGLTASNARDSKTSHLPLLTCSPRRNACVALATREMRWRAMLASNAFREGGGGATPVTGQRRGPCEGGARKTTKARKVADSGQNRLTKLRWRVLPTRRAKWPAAPADKPKPSSTSQATKG